MAAGLALTVASLLPTGAHAQQRAPLKLSIKSTVDVMRSNSPLLLDATLTWSSPRLLEGRLELDLYVGQQHVAEYRSREVALSASKVTLPLMLPHMVPADEQTACTLQARFEGSEESIELGGYDVAAPVLRRRVLVVGVVIAEDSSNPPGGIRAPGDQPFALHESLRIESRLTRDDLLRDLSCRVVEVLPEAIPVCGLELCGFDALIVTSDGLDGLDSDQLEAIADWVEAGGSVCIVPEQVRDRRQQALLQRIAGGSIVAPVLAFDAAGTPRLLQPGPAGWRHGAPGIGRSIIADSAIDVTGHEWQRGVCYLLGVRASRVDDVLAAEQATRDEVSDEVYARFDPTYQPYAARPLPDESRLPMLLMPEKIEGVPFRLVCGLLVGCLLAVAPGEYFLLGLLRRRRWTWVVFPCTAVGCTFFMIGLAQSYVGNADHATSLTFVDLAADGRAVRTSRFELTFTATERTLESPIERQFVVALDARPREATAALPFTWQQRPRKLAAPAPTPFDVAQAPFMYDGRSPLSYTLSRPLRQWSPRLARWSAFGRQAAEEPALPGIDWSALSVESLGDQSAQRALAAQIQRTAPAAHVLVASTGRSMWLDTERLGFAPDDPAAPIAGLVFAASVREPEGLFEYFTQRSPACTADMEDLALLDRTDPRQKLVVVLVADGAGSYTAYRRLERGLE